MVGDEDMKGNEYRIQDLPNHVSSVLALQPLHPQHPWPCCTLPRYPCVMLPASPPFAANGAHSSTGGNNVPIEKSVSAVEKGMHEYRGVVVVHDEGKADKSLGGAGPTA